MPPGIHATFPLESKDLPAAARILGQVFIARLKSDAARFRECPAALELALWLRSAFPEIAGLYQLREGVCLWLALEDSSGLSDVERALLTGGAPALKEEGLPHATGGEVRE